MRRHFGQGVFESDETSFDTTAFPSSRFGFQFARVALWYLRQDPDKWPRNETRFEDDLRDGMVTVVRELSKYVTLSVTTEASTDRLTSEDFNEKTAIDFKGSQAIDVLLQEPDVAMDSIFRNKDMEPHPPGGLMAISTQIGALSSSRKPDNQIC